MKFTPGVAVGTLSGTAGGATAANWRGVGYFRKYNPSPANPNNAAQKLTRASMAHLVNVWKHSPSRFRLAWDKFAEGQPFSGYNAFIHANLKAQRTNYWTVGQPSNPSVFAVSSLVVSDGAAHKVKFDWLLGDATGTLKVDFYTWKDVHPIDMAAVHEEDAIVQTSSEDTVLASALTALSAAHAGAGDFLGVLSVYQPLLAAGHSLSPALAITIA